MDVAGDPPAFGDGFRQPRELVLEQDDVGDAFGHLGPRAHRHRQPRLLERGDVVDAVADHRRVAARFAQRRRPVPSSARARSGRRSCSRCAASASALRVGGQVGPLDRAGVGGHADRAGDRGHGRAGVAGDQLQVDFLLAHEGDRLPRVRAQRLFEHDQRQRRRGAAAALRRGRRAAARRTRRRRRPAGRSPVSRSSARCRPAGRLSAPAPLEHVGRAHHVAAAADRAGRSTSTPRRRAPRRCTRLGLAGEALGDRLQRAVALAGAGGEAGQRRAGRRRLDAVGDLDPDQLAARRRSASRSCRRRSCRRRRAPRSRSSAGRACCVRAAAPRRRRR